MDFHNRRDPGLRELAIVIMIYALALLLFSIGGCSTGAKKERLERENPGCTYIEDEDRLSCPLPWESEPCGCEETLSKDDIKQLMDLSTGKKTKKKKIKRGKP